MKNCILKDRKLSLISRISIILIWILLSKIVNNDIIVPSIKSTFLSMVKIVTDVNFLSIVGYTILRTLLGFLISLFIATVMGVLSSSFKIIYNLMVPILELLNSIPTIAIIVLALIWLNHELVPMFIGFIMVFPVLFETVLNSILNVDKGIIEMARVYKVYKMGIIRNIYMPSILFNLNSILKSALAINLKMVIAGEVLSQPKYAIGSSIQLERMYLNTSGVFAWIIIILFISAIFDFMTRVFRFSLGTDKWK